MLIAIEGCSYKWGWQCQDHFNGNVLISLTVDPPHPSIQEAET